jgi:8-oxo-dGTP diphosphatase
MIIIASGILRQNKQILLVKQQGKGDPGPSWALPGGVVRAGELLTEALIREVREETGLGVIRVGPSSYITLIDDQVERYKSLAFISEIEDWEGNLRSEDPDNLIQDVGFYDLPAAVQKLNVSPIRVMSESAIAYLRG